MRTSLSRRCGGKATGPGGALSPALDADIKLIRAGEDAAVLAVSGVYRPPLGDLGAGLDRVVLHRFARTTIRTFTHRIGSAIVNPVISPDAADTDSVAAKSTTHLIGVSRGFEV